MSQIIVLAEQQSGRVPKATLCAIAAGRELAAKTGGGFSIAIAGSGLDAVAAQLAGFGAEKVYQIEHDALGGYTAQAHAQALAAVASDVGARFVVAAATAVGKDVTPRVAARLGAGQASEVLSIEVEGGQVTYRRPMWAGNVIARVRVNTAVQAITIRPTEFEPATPQGASPIERIAGAVDTAALRMTFVGLEAVASDRPELTDADVVVAGGRGLKDAEKFKLIERFADQLGAAVGATRAVVDAGWVPNDLQVGQTGKVVAPNLYFAIGISGAIQHLAGMKGSKTIVAINKDEEAPIFSVADYGLVADLFEVLPELMQKLAERSG